MGRTYPPTQLVIDDMAILVSKKKVAPTLMLPKIVPVVEKQGHLVEIQKRRIYLNRANNEHIKEGVTWRDAYFDGDNEVQEPMFAQVLPDGNLKRCSLYAKTTVMTPDPKSPYITLTELQNFVFDGGVYEVFLSARKYNKNEASRMLQKAYDKASELVAAKKAIRFKYSHRDQSMRVYIAHLWPVIQRKEDGSLKFVFLMGLSTTALHYENMMDVPSTAVVSKEDIVEEPEVAIDAIVASTGRVKGVVETMDGGQQTIDRSEV